jgi:maltooligosyltrehalose trehalohydrolase
VPDPQAEKTFEQCILSWNLNEPHRKTLLTYYKYLITLRKTRLALQGQVRDSVKVYEPKDDVICFERSTGADRLLIVLNFNSTSVDFALPSAITNVKKIFDSADSQWGGDKTENKAAGSGDIRLSPFAALIFEF